MYQMLVNPISLTNTTRHKSTDKPQHNDSGRNFNTPLSTTDRSSRQKNQTQKPQN
jgi:hypothetical protein